MSIFRQESKEGHLVVDHRASPGLKPSDLIGAGFNPLQAEALAVPEGKMFEAATLTCGHCNGTVVKNPKRTRERGHCKKCNDFVCDGCAALGDCYPIQAVIDNVLGTDKPNPFLISPLLRAGTPTTQGDNPK